MTKNAVGKTWSMPAVGNRRYSTIQTYPPRLGLRFIPNDIRNQDFGRLDTLPTNFGAQEFTLDLWIRLISAGSTPWGTVTSGSTVSSKTRTISTDNPTMYNDASWWNLGGFIIDGHNNNNDANGSFNLQNNNSGRLQWTFGNGATADARTGNLHAVRTTTAILDDLYHRVRLILRYININDCRMEIELDGVVEGTEIITNARVNMWTTYWQSWSGYPANQNNWIFGAEKICAGTTGANGTQDWEDAFFTMSELAFFDRVPTDFERANWRRRLVGNESGLLGYYPCTEQAGASVARAGGSGGNIALVNTSASNVWIREAA